MNSSFFRTTSIFFIISIIFIFLCFTTIISSLSYSNNVSFSNSSIFFPDNTIISFSSSRFYLAYSTAILPLPPLLAIEMLQLLVHLLITLELILVHQSGTNILAIFSGTVTYVGFSGAGGYTVTVKHENFTASYCHVSPNLLVSVGEYVLKRNHNCKCWS